LNDNIRLIIITWGFIFWTKKVRRQRRHIPY